MPHQAKSVCHVDDLVQLPLENNEGIRSIEDSLGDIDAGNTTFPNKKIKQRTIENYTAQKNHFTKQVAPLEKQLQELDFVDQNFGLTGEQQAEIAKKKRKGEHVQADTFCLAHQDA